MATTRSSGGLDHLTTVPENFDGAVTGTDDEAGMDDGDGPANADGPADRDGPEDTSDQADVPAN